jgi:CheY-like chemotaxis protein
MSILVVDDQPSLRTLLTIFLEDVNYTVVEAADGRDALRYLHHTNDLPGLILLDVAMPVMTGWQFLSAQQREPRFASIPVVLMTALAGIPHAAKFQAVVGYLYKPLDLHHLTDIIAAHYTTPLQENALGA